MKKAFTLIEVMVVLSILAIIAILAYNFFGSTMKDAALSQQATELRKYVVALDNAQQLYYNDNGALPAVSANAFDDLVAGGYIKAVPDLSDSIKKASGCTATNTATGTGMRTYDGQILGTISGASERYGMLFCLPTDLCQHYNDTYTNLGVGAALPVDFSGTAAAGGSMCYDNGNATITGILIYLFENN